MNTTLQEFLKVAEEAAIAGGRVLLEHRFAPLEITHKDRQEVVTNVDTLADAAISNVLSHYFPDHSIISEESGTRTTASPYTWIVDPGIGRGGGPRARLFTDDRVIGEIVAEDIANRRISQGIDIRDHFLAVFVGDL